MFNKKQFYILLILILILAGVVFVFRLRYDKWPWQKSVTLPSPTASPEATISGSPSPVKEPREIVMLDAAARIGEISPVEPVLGGKWYVLRYWFLDGSYNTFYVECEEGHIMRKFLLVADLSQLPKISYSVKAVFEPGESDWMLKSGEDQHSGRNLILYEFDQTAGRWTQKN